MLMDVPSKGRSLGGDTFLETSISEETVGVVVDELEAVFVEGSSHVSLGNGKTNSVGDTLTKRTSGDLDTVSDTSLGVTGGDGVNLSE